MPHKPAITPAGRPVTKPSPDLPEWEVRLTMNVTKRIRAMYWEEASDIAWEEALNNGEVDMDVQEVGMDIQEEDTDGVS